MSSFKEIGEKQPLKTASGLLKHRSGLLFSYKLMKLLSIICLKKAKNKAPAVIKPENNGLSLLQMAVLTHGSNK